ncbi:hypothetical protein [Treponema phagedenis]|uniref:hypothetical protein n=1 Tax=Treponema phagedenis TaxID=162 RepID=UPI0001F63C68|nr:hypothetical protein [Treponema phagedenis]EFW37913.1 hypothetical protein HMPREF9554_01561 [Treponema phagedenis F0421]TYT76892.1 hypothetical protein FS559_13425 [Treponema phagedenis]TYT79815.1 hypothetical protein FS559_12430 [Treponema phagedenis]
MLKSLDLYTPLATKESFNASVRHIQNVLAVLDDCDPKMNIADQINELLVEKKIQNDQVAALLSVLLIDIWKYKVVSANLKNIPADPQKIAAETGKWKGIDLVFGYHHPDLGFLAINPKNPANASLIESFRKNELLLIYVGQQDRGALADDVADKVIKAVFNLLDDKVASVPPAVLKGSFVYAEPKKTVEKPKTTKMRRTRKTTVAQKETAAVASPQPSATARPPVQAPTGPVRMSQLISVPVSNELFHNGNVEAWKRIIRSYNAKYPTLEVIVFYDGERIVDINTLFKWGKVKHGSVIQFAVSGEDIKDLSKLLRYFKEGASPRFEAFLRGSPDTVLNLF